MFQGKGNHYTFLGLAWVIHDLLVKYEGFWFFILYLPWLDESSHSHWIITNRLLSLLFHVDVVEQLRWWVIIILHLFNVSHQLNGLVQEGRKWLFSSNFFSFKSAWIFACAFQLSRKTFSCIFFWLKCSCSALLCSLCTFQYFVTR